MGGFSASIGSLGVVVAAVAVPEGTGLASESAPGVSYLSTASFIDICGAATPWCPTRNCGLAITTLFSVGLGASARSLSGVDDWLDSQL